MEPGHYVYAAEAGAEGVSMALSQAGLSHGRNRAGAHDLAQYVLSLEGWRGSRSEANIASEIRAHCLAWFWLPPLRGRANPVDLEFHHAWPANLLVAFRRSVFGHGVE